MQKLDAKYDYEHIFCDNNSTDDTFEKIKHYARIDRRVKAIKLSRNVGPVRNIWNGLKFAKGDLIIPMLPADLQDPPEAIAGLLQKWEEGFEIVYGVRTHRSENKVLSISRKLYYYLIRKFGEIKLPRNAGDFMLIPKNLLRNILQAENQYPYLRGFVAQTNPNFATFEYPWLKRTKGKSKNNYWTLLDEAINGIISTSKVPARLALLSGLVLGFLSVAFTILNFVFLVSHHNRFSNGIPTIIIGIFLVGGIQLFFLGLIGEYVLSIHNEVRTPPPFDITEKLNFD